MPGMMPDRDMVDLTIRHFVDCVISGEEFSLDPKVTRDELAVVCAAHQSFETGQAVKIQY